MRGTGCGGEEAGLTSAIQNVWYADKGPQKVIPPHFSFFHLDTSIYRPLLKATDDSEGFIKSPPVCLQLRKLFKHLR